MVVSIGNLGDGYFLFLNVPALKLSIIIIIILPTSQPEIILSTSHATKN